MAKQTRRLGRGLSSLIQSTKSELPSENDVKPASDALKAPSQDDLAAEEPHGSSFARTIEPTKGESVSTSTNEVRVGSPDRAASERDSPADGGSRARTITVAGEDDAIANLEGRALQTVAELKPRPKGSILDAALAGAGNREAERDSDRSGRDDEMVRVRIDAIVPNPHQPRQHFDSQSIASLAASIARNGMIQPLVVRPMSGQSDGAQDVVRYELVSGERRWRASRAAGTEDVPVIIRTVDDERSLELALIENIQREDLNAIDRAEAYQRYCREFGLRPEEVAKRLAEDRTTVVNYIRLLELPEKVRDLVAEGKLSMGHARAILGIEGAESRTDAAQSAVTNGLSVRALEEVVRRKKLGRGSGPKSDGRSTSQSDAEVPQRSAHLVDMESRFQQALGTKVRIRPSRGKNRGKITIEYYSLDDFDRIAQRLGIQLS